MDSDAYGRGFLGVRSAAAVISALLVFCSAGPAQAALTIYQAEAETISQGIIETTNGGFTGSGYVNYNNAVGSFVQWVIHAPAAGTYLLNFRYAIGVAEKRPMEVFVNGQLANGRVMFNPTGAWATWTTEGLNVQLVSGSNVVRARAITAHGGPNVDRLEVSDQPPASADWSKLLVDSTLQRFPTASSLGPWEYSRSLYLYGQYLVFKRTGTPAYLQYIQSWVDSHVDAGGTIDASLNNLDNMLPGNLLLALYRETGQDKYRLGAKRIRDRFGPTFNAYPSTTDGAYWHNTGAVGQNWADGVFMAQPFLVRYGQMFGDTATFNVAANQLVLYANHLRRSNGLFFHAFDEQRDASWANPSTGQSPESWCRALGWFGMTMIDVLEVLPTSHPQRPQILSNLRALVQALSNVQDPTTGLWFQVVDKGAVLDNWHETSCTCMHAYTMQMAVKRGYVATSFQAVANKGRRGVLTKLSLGADGRTRLADISVGTNVGALPYYLARPAATNDMHGLGAFIIMNEAFAQSGS